MVELDWNAVELVVFDLDGTLYDQRPLRRRMLAELAYHCLIHPGDLGILRVISRFRRVREELAEEEASNPASEQYARPASELGIDAVEVERVVRVWIEERPLPFLRRCRFPAVGRFFDALRRAGKSIAVLSDYPTRRKLKALELDAQIQICALDPEVNRLKPHPRGLERTLELAGVAAGSALLIGDRDDRDGACARRAAVSFLLKTRGPGPQGASFQSFEQLLSSLRMGRARISTLQ